MMDITSDLQVLAGTIAGEARGDIPADQQGVACVVMNRATEAKAYVAEHGKPHPLYGDGTARSACLAHEQFDAWMPGDPNRIWINAQSWDGSSMDRSVQAAIVMAGKALAGQLPDITKGATSYKTTTLPWPSEWGPEVQPLVILGEQAYYRL